MSTNLLILGTRTFAIETADIVSEIPEIQTAGFVENLDRDRCRDKLEGLSVYWIDELTDLAESHYAVCALSTTHRKKFIEQAAQYGLSFTKIIHNSSRISSTSCVGNGSIIHPGTIIASHTSLGQHVIVNRGALIGHHTEIGDYSSVQPGANIAGACSIDQSVYIGMGSVIIDKVSVGANSVIAAGAVVVNDVPANVMVAGVPGKIIKQNIDGK